MEVAVEIVNLVRRIPAVGRRQPGLVGRPLWHALRLTAPISLRLVPLAIEAAGINWPHLTNHFMSLEAESPPTAHDTLKLDNTHSESRPSARTTARMRPKPSAR